jgi:peptidoglycan/LPS O-acetylase OafA/YrhL
MSRAEVADVATSAQGSRFEEPPQLSAGAYFPSLDGYRALAALSVVLFHTVSTLGLGSTRWWGELILPMGSFGVSVFFLLSGFLLYRPFVLAAVKRSPSPRLGVYYTRRFFRILPGYWLALAGLFFVFGVRRVDLVRRTELLRRTAAPCVADAVR